MSYLRLLGIKPSICWRPFGVLLVAAIALKPSVGTSAIAFPQADDFQDGTTKNWTNGGAPGAPPTENIPDGGPSGAGDKFLEVASTGIGRDGSKLVTFNTTQWAGNYNAAGVSAIGMDLKYISVGDPMIDIRPIRIALFSSFGSGYSSANAVAGGSFSLPDDGQWHHWTFSLDASALTVVGAPPPLATDLSSMPQLRILSSAAPATGGDQITVQLGIDNITAVPTPILGDLNRDGHFNVADIQAMANALSDLSGYQAYWGLTNGQLNALGNFDGDMVVTNAEFQGLICALANGGGGSVSAVPEPAALVESMIGGVLLVILRVCRRVGRPQRQRLAVRRRFA